MPRRALLALPAALVVAAGLAVAPSPASADSVTTTDGQRDVWFFAAQDGPDWQRVRDRKVDDLRSVRVDHLDDQVVLTTRMVELPPRGESPGAGPRHTIFRPGDQRVFVYADVSGGQPPSVQVYPAGSRHRICRGRDSLIVVDRRAQTVTVRLSTACLGRPDWIRVSSREYSPTGRNYYYDSVGTHFHNDGTITRKLYAG